MPKAKDRCWLCGYERYLYLLKSHCGNTKEDGTPWYICRNRAACEQRRGMAKTKRK